jgi:hypothetical protein
MLDAAVQLEPLRLRLSDVQFRDLMYAVDRITTHTVAPTGAALDISQLTSQLHLDPATVADPNDTNAAANRAEAYKQIWKRSLT